MALDDFRSHVLDGANKGRYSLCDSILFLQFSKRVIREFDMTLVSDQNIFRLECSIYNPFLMQILQPCNYLCQNVSNDFLWQFDSLLFCVEVEVAL